MRTHRSTRLALVAAVAWLVAAPAVQAAPVVGLGTVGGNANTLVVFDTANPGQVIYSVPVTGLAAGSNLVGIDFRPATGQLFGVAQGAGGAGQVYSFNLSSGIASPVGNPLPAGTLSGTAFGVDFNPVPDALRIVSNTGQNLRITAAGGGTLNTDAALNPAPQNAGVTGAAYSNNVPGGVGGQTTLYEINSALGTLLTQGSVSFPPGTSPNTGTLFTVGSLGLGTSLTSDVGFDISGANGTALASIGNNLYSINLNTGATTPAGTVGGGVALRDVSFGPAGFGVPEPMSLAVFGVLAVGGVVAARRRRKAG